jgi:hypothetical protein
MKNLDLEQMEKTQGGSVESCIVGGIMTGLQLMAFGPWGFFGGMAMGCAVAQLR